MPPENMKWDDSVAADLHQKNKVNGNPNKEVCFF